MAERFRTYRSPGNLNNEIGLPLSLLEIDAGDRGRRAGDGRRLCLRRAARCWPTIARPAVAVVTNVYPVHLERMGTIEAIAETKAELVEALPADGVAVLNGDDPRVRAMAGRAPRPRRHLRSRRRQRRPGRPRSRPRRWPGPRSGSTWAGSGCHVKVPLVGGHAVELALAGIAVGHALGMHISEMLPGFADPAIQVRLLVLPGPNGSRLIDDTYNASTPSVLSALGLLATLKPRRAIAVLGDMRELGRSPRRSTASSAAAPARWPTWSSPTATWRGSSREEARRVDGRTAPLGVTSFGLDQREELVAYLLRELREGTWSCSRARAGCAMEEIVAALRADTGPIGSTAASGGR